MGDSTGAIAPAKREKDPDESLKKRKQDIAGKDKGLNAKRNHPSRSSGESDPNRSRHFSNSSRGSDSTGAIAPAKREKDPDESLKKRKQDIAGKDKGLNAKRNHPSRSSGESDSNRNRHFGNSSRESDSTGAIAPANREMDLYERLKNCKQDIAGKGHGLNAKRNHPSRSSGESDLNRNRHFSNSSRESDSTGAIAPAKREKDQDERLKNCRQEIAEKGGHGLSPKRNQASRSSGESEPMGTSAPARKDKVRHDRQDRKRRDIAGNCNLSNAKRNRPGSSSSGSDPATTAAERDQPADDRLEGKRRDIGTGADRADASTLRSRRSASVDSEENLPLKKRRRLINEGFYFESPASLVKEKGKGKKSGKRRPSSHRSPSQSSHTKELENKK